MSDTRIMETIDRIQKMYDKELAHSNRMFVQCEKLKKHVHVLELAGYVIGILSFAAGFIVGGMK